MRLINLLPLIIALVFIGIFYFITNLTYNSKDYIHKLSTLDLNLSSGEKLDLKKFRGKSIILHIFSSWCESCKEDLPYLQQMKKKYNAIVIGLAKNDTNPKINSVYDFLATDNNSQVFRMIGSNKVPETLIINSEGIVIFHQTEPLNSQAIKSN